MEGNLFRNYCIGQEGLRLGQMGGTKNGHSEVHHYKTQIQHYYTYVGAMFVLEISSSFNLISSLSFGYSSNLLARPTAKN